MNQFFVGLSELGGTSGIYELYDKVKLPQRATKGSAGYDFFAVTDIELKPGESLKIPTGIRAKIDEGWVLKIYPRSGLGFKYRLQLDNTVGIIDSDYYNSSNEGHIMIKMTNNSLDGKTVYIPREQPLHKGYSLNTESPWMTIPRVFVTAASDAQQNKSLMDFSFERTKK